MPVANKSEMARLGRITGRSDFLIEVKNLVIFEKDPGLPVLFRPGKENDNEPCSVLFNKAFPLAENGVKYGQERSQFGISFA